MPKIGLALSGGGARGFAHIGVIKVLEKNNIPVDFISGSSIGALVGAFYSFFKDAKKLEDISLSNDLKKIFWFLSDFSLKEGLIKGENIEQFIAGTIENSSFSGLKIPFSAVATDFNNGETVCLSEGNVASAVRASMAFPLLLEPVLTGGRLLWDGGLSCPFPIGGLEKMGADIIIGVNLYNKTMFEDGSGAKENFASVAVRSIESLQYHLTEECLGLADVIINPSVGGLGLVGLDKFFKDRGKGIILEGEKAAELALPEIKRIISERSSQK